MTTEEFNALPLQARQYIEKEQAGACCGKVLDVDALYKNYLLMSKKALFALRMGAVNYKTEAGKGGVLYPIHPSDSDEVVREKLATALEVYAIAPGKFDDIQEDKIKKILGAEPKVVELKGAAKAAADKKAAKDAAAKAAEEAEAQAKAAVTDTDEDNLE